MFQVHICGGSNKSENCEMQPIAESLHEGHIDVEMIPYYLLDYSGREEQKG